MNGETLAFAFGAVGRWLTYLSVVTIVGTAGVAVGIGRTWRVDRSDGVVLTERRVLRTAIAAALVLLGVTVWRLYAQAYSVFGLDETVTWEHVRIIVFETAWGRGWLWQAVAAGLAALVLASAMKVAPIRGILVTVAAVAAVAVVPLTGHAISREGGVWLSVAFQVFHVAGVGFWIGTLFIVMLVLRPRSDEVFVAAIRAFSPLAMAAVATIAVSGVVTAFVYLESVSELWTGVYGRTLVLKLMLFASVGALGAYNRRRVLPGLDRPSQVRILNRTARVELLIAGLTLAVTAVLVALPLVHD